MLHIYRQITALERVRPIVVAQKREFEARFPFSPVYVVPKPPTHFLRRFWHRQLRDEPWQISKGELDALVGLLRRSETQLLHIYFGHIGVHLLPLINAWPKPSVVSFHGADVMVDLDKPAYRRATLEMLRAVRRVLVRSESLATALRALGCEPRKIDIVRTGIPLAEFEYQPRAFPTDGQWRILQAGRLIEKKGYPTSLRAFARFVKHQPYARLTIAGEGPMLTELQTLAGELKIGSRVEFRGLLEPNELRRLFQLAHIFLHPSQTGGDGNQEGVPNSMLEAMATGLPVLATNHGGIPEAIKNGVSGMLVDEGNADGLAEALLAATRDQDLLARMGQAGADVVRQKFDQRSQVRILEDIYLRVIGG